MVKRMHGGRRLTPQNDGKEPEALWQMLRMRRRPNDDPCPESRRVDQDSIEITGELKRGERERFLAKSIITSLRREREAGRSLALLKPDVIEFIAERKSDADLDEEKKRFEALRAQGDRFSKQVTPYRPCPYKFKYRYRTEDGERLGSCQDWEIEATYFNRSNQYGETKALDELQCVFGEEYPKKGMLLAMGNHSLYPDTWLINGVIRLDDVKQSSLF